MTIKERADTMKHLYFSENTFKLYDFNHLMMLFLISLLIFGLNKLKHEQITKRERIVRIILLMLFTLQQGLLYSWYYYTNNFNVIDALPLYPCRITQLLSIVYIINSDESIYNILKTLSVPSAIIALLLADTNNLGFPNAMFIQFFLGHSLMIITPNIINKAHNYQLSKHYLKHVYIAISAYFLFVTLINHQLDANYGYITRGPEAITILHQIPHVIYSVGYFLLYCLLATIVFHLSVGWSHIKKVYITDKFNTFKFIKGKNM